MSYSTHSIVRPIAGRLALDFLNTANWTTDDRVLEEKIESFSDLELWMRALSLPDALPPDLIEDLHTFRSQLRSLFVKGERVSIDQFTKHVSKLVIHECGTVEYVRQQPILSLIAVSALSVLSDERELKRVKKCPGSECGWLFIDETKNGRRKWCTMETCGNRAKSARNYARRIQNT
ncbi:CGNR zinc finger domain-containing protein [Ruegeria meonggei]|uniref:CGNR zinc finger n=1 Tax=Ruegeria meonggei TaxID=1446476 RepID=A0A1X6YXH9_9RHOB|nr:CGNR zinc finger domain-containing protein [Ruegeria meonggei]SLN33739.1 CGNR zinc finger [Ruegeria meonggei]